MRTVSFSEDELNREEIAYREVGAHSIVSSFELTTRDGRCG
ncbi:MAG: hypothetical protein ACI8XU_002195 [Kiritimatiellia bacterium]|jgi:hypothetical protein